MAINLKTENCIVCGKKAKNWHGHVIGSQKMALGNLVEKKVLAGFCEDHVHYSVSDSSGCYGNYNPRVMGACLPFRL